MEEATSESHFCLVYKANEDSLGEAYVSFKAPSEDKRFKLKF